MTVAFEDGLDVMGLWSALTVRAHRCSYDLSNVVMVVCSPLYYEITAHLALPSLIVPAIQ